MSIVRLLAVLTFGSVALIAQEFGLKDYLTLLEVAPGVTVEQKIAALDTLGVKLSQQGMVDLRMSVASPNYRGATRSTAQKNIVVDGTATDAPTAWTRRPYASAKPAASNDGGSNVTYQNTDNGVVSAVTNGNTTWYNGAGVQGHGTTVGNTTWYNSNNGVQGHGTNTGDTTWYHFNNGVTGHSTTVGGTTWTTLSDGRQCITQKVGSSTQTRCH